MGRAGGLLVDGTAEEHLRIGALEDAGRDAGAPLVMMICFIPTGYSPPTQQPIWPTAHTASTGACF